ncbi:hypothetical protein [Nocardia altamirensis]|uniref:hypothetical protein n=1 Tax=Nocardia altamirensis TaxID=472158 RepID=UPI00083FEE1D|nr:hypothetical protein [Nocardia altamirensis]
MPSVHVQGAARLEATLRRAAAGMDELRQVHRAAAAMVAVRARSLAPHRSGRLVGTVRVSGTRRGGMVRVGDNTTPYAGPIHWGWPARAIAADPFVARAAQQSEPGWVGLYARHRDELLDQVKGL